jgi:hypothetical protein
MTLPLFAVRKDNPFYDGTTEPSYHLLAVARTQAKAEVKAEILSAVIR